MSYQAAFEDCVALNSIESPSGRALCISLRSFALPFCLGSCLSLALRGNEARSEDLWLTPSRPSEMMTVSRATNNFRVDGQIDV